MLRYFRTHHLLSAKHSCSVFVIQESRICDGLYLLVMWLQDIDSISTLQQEAGVKFEVYLYSGVAVMQDLKNNRYIENLFLFNIWGVFINHMAPLLTCRHKHARVLF